MRYPLFEGLLDSSYLFYVVRFPVIDPSPNWVTAFVMESQYSHLEMGMVIRVLLTENL